MNASAAWYNQLTQPFFAPPAWVFAPVWTVLYVVIAITFGYVFWLAFQGRIAPMTALPFGLNVLFNLAFTPLQFGLKNNLLAALDILLVLATLIWALRVIWPPRRWVALANLPYLAWVMFATALQLSITWLNR